VSMDALREEVETIMRAEGITVRYDAVASMPGVLAEGEYKPDTRTVIIDRNLSGYPDEPLTLAHEIGHHFDILQNADPTTPMDERERRADLYMVGLGDKHDIGARARKIANYHRPGSYPGA
jgi:hypothetical protein